MVDPGWVRGCLPRHSVGIICRYSLDHRIKNRSGMLLTKRQRARWSRFLWLSSVGSEAGLGVKPEYMLGHECLQIVDVSLQRTQHASHLSDWSFYPFGGEEVVDSNPRAFLRIWRLLPISRRSWVPTAELVMPSFAYSPETTRHWITTVLHMALSSASAPWKVDFGRPHFIGLVSAGIKTMQRCYGGVFGEVSEHF